MSHEESLEKVIALLPRHEMRVLEAHIRGVSVSELDFLTQPLNEYERLQLQELSKLRIKGVPLQYLTGVQYFYGRPFYVNTAVLVPRPETEVLVEAVLNQISEQSSSNSGLIGLEFGLGSGCISLTLSLEKPNIKMIATESSVEAIEVALENQKKLNEFSLQIKKVHEEPNFQDYEFFPQFDFIVSNPPYLLKTDEVAQDVLEHEPHDALYSGDEDGRKYYSFLKTIMDQKLKKGGFAAYEISHDRSKLIQGLFEWPSYMDRVYQTQLLKDLTGRDRVLLVYG